MKEEKITNKKLLQTSKDSAISVNTDIGLKKGFDRRMKIIELNKRVLIIEKELESLKKRVLLCEKSAKK
ncbi:MAG: hypothetical protein US83_C0009G0034 [Candidatus Falkowbacteria bacterium GW2011_GWC2_38_22]|uniref:Uncharacterized protein n=1 Tax=Candidatus Falkowbacteria bacterium GW2011_GWE1_38_31 TaxID=1618638 RepID=A0A0G0M8G3_9BACT|nr:MAG: hypothetical protein US73_C0012G0034 [Candidatus Falkowbacteria bacterium GW2011_GWF2_38_1205]KKQ61128.1 MAG: hypothetical protein US83_C0009G0034 [Candidatus Falkowbacteria bacterium GW2011_GWC2_38_22]KKQ63197.1 MAG: hypothetical protein US84_C0008G0090 [Candidatus Falkowbacteria bacterium GW2011_GWF1_38_22]KKQ65392.1 MAG: hypothetical protein US87_C0008G0088 [Candidatus Falkowbacteria bacterium GW2011_GWE2_38_254]KKQ69969.1 MAG: hypothetical protein US91_C0008G0089 [Candidatus Falkowb